MLKKLETTSAFLHIAAMALMLCDHLWGTVIPGNDWLNCIGRISFPIFAFLLVEGYFHTKNLKKYLFRLLIFAIISEIPFNLAIGSRIFYPVHQNVLWTFLIGLLLICLNEKAQSKGRLWIRILTAAGSVVIGFLLGILTMVDYHHAGIFTVLVFYFFRDKKWWHRLAQLLLLFYINNEILAGVIQEVSLFGHTFAFHRQLFALLALVPIWLYRGRQGHHSKAFQYFCYAFYPLHLTVLAIIKLI